MGHGQLKSRLREAMAEAGMDEPQLAKATGISQPAINLIKNGKREPTLGNAVRIAKALGLRLDQIWSVE